MIIGFYDETNYTYPMIEISSTRKTSFEDILDKYKKEDDEYNFDGFLELLETMGILKQVINFDEEVYF